NIKGFAKISPQLVPNATDPTDVDIQLALAADASEVNNVTMRIRIYTLYDGDAPPELFVSPTELTLVTAPASSGNSQSATLTNRGGGILTWSAGPASQPWLTITPTSGSISAGASSSLTIAVDVTGLALGTYDV